jgi:hypothetical protein
MDVATEWATKAQLEVCRKWLHERGSCLMAEAMVKACRPQVLNDKERALSELDTLEANLKAHGLGVDLSNIRKVVEQLNGSPIS